MKLELLSIYLLRKDTVDVVIIDDLRTTISEELSSQLYIQVNESNVEYRSIAFVKLKWS